MNETTQAGCIFCSIIAKNEDNILYRDDDIIIINDIKAASKYHFLVIPVKHIIDAKRLTKEDKPLVETMIANAKMILEKNNLDVSDTRFAFHWPPFHSVAHLHLHAISPMSGMSFLSKLIFKPNTWCPNMFWKEFQHEKQQLYLGASSLISSRSLNFANSKNQGLIGVR